MFARYLSAIFACLVLTPFVPAFAGVDDPARPEFAIEKAALQSATDAFFAQVEATRIGPVKKPVLGWSAPAVRKIVQSDDNVSILTQKGTVRNLTGYQVSWYPVDRLLGTIDFMGTWDGNRNLVCGYLTWDLSDPETPKLESVTAQFLDLRDLAAADPAQVHQMLFGANCAFGSIDSNYAFFDVSG